MIEPADNNNELPQARRILLYGDVNLNVMDGSAVWLVSMAEVLSRTNSVVDVLLKAPIENDRLVRNLTGSARIRFIQPFTRGDGVSLSPRQAAQRMLGLDSESNYDVIIARGFNVCQFLAGSSRLAAKSWLYVTDLPFPKSALTEPKKEALGKIARNAKRMFAQTEDARSYLESVIPEAAGKTILLPPMVPDEFYARGQNVALESTSLKLVYAGKFAKSWRTLEMCGIESRLSERGITAELTFIGDKIQGDNRDPDWPLRMEKALNEPDINWLGGLTREETRSVVSRSHIGLGWRNGDMSSSLEISTKALEYAAAGVCPLINRTEAHERLFGESYPFFIDHDNIDSVVDALVDGIDEISNIQETVRNAAEYYSMGRAAQRLEVAFSRAGLFASQETQVWTERPRRLKVVLAGHDFKFAGELVDLLESDKSIDLRLDRWETLHKNDVEASKTLVEWADVVICEWAGPNAVWYSQHKRRDQALVVRLHAFELRGPWLPNIVSDALDAVVCVSDLYRELTIDKTSWPRDKFCVIPNSIDVADLDRPKLDGYEYRLGLVGFVPFLKRPDRALDVLEELIHCDDRYTLHIRGRMPWEYPYEWNKPLQQEAYLNFFGRIGGDSKLQSRVIFEPFGADMASWLSKIGYVLSPSTRESFHLAPAEGMASGAVPVFWDRPGVSEIFGNEFRVPNSEAAASMILSLSSNGQELVRASERARKKACHFDLVAVKAHWSAVINDVTTRIVR